MPSHRSLITAAGVLAAVLFLHVGSARADDSHYQDFFVGTRAAGLGGAFTGLANDASALWLNPGGLVFARRSNLNISTSFYGFEFQRMDGHLGEQGAARDGRGFRFFDDLQAVPVTFGGVIGLGRQYTDRTYRHAIAFYFGFPAHTRVIQERRETSQTPGAFRDILYQRELTDSLWVGGGGYALRANRYLSLGIAVFYMSRLLKRSDHVSHRLSPEGGGAPEFRDTRVNFLHQTGALLIGLGSRLRITKHWSVGLSVQSPSLGVRGASEVRVLDNAAGDTMTAAGIQAERHVLVSENVLTQRPLTARAGVAFVLPRTLTATFDVSVFAPTTYRIFHEDPIAEQYVGVPTRVRRNAVANVNAGFEWLIIKKLSISVGGFTNLSSAPDIPAAPTGLMVPHIHLYGGSFAIGYYAKHSLLRLGAVASYGRGHTVVRGADHSAPAFEDASFHRVRLTRFMIHVYLATTFRY